MSALPFHISSSLLLMEKDNVPILHGGKQIVKVAKVLRGAGRQKWDLELLS